MILFSIFSNCLINLGVDSMTAFSFVHALIRIYAGTQQNKNITIHTNMQQKNHFISLISNNWNLLTDRMEIRLARALVAISEKICGGYRPLNWVTMRLEGLFIIEKQWRTLNIQKPNPRRWSAKTMGPVWVNWCFQLPRDVTLAYYLRLTHMIHH